VNLYQSTISPIKPNTKNGFPEVRPPVDKKLDLIDVRLGEATRIGALTSIGVTHEASIAANKRAINPRCIWSNETQDQRRRARENVTRTESVDGKHS
jgi:hypothetical protein